MELGMKCSRGYISHEECRRCAVNPLHPCGLPPDLLEMMRGENSHEPDALSFTPSRLLGVCDRQTVLMGQADYYIDVDRQWSLLRGHMVHALLERSGRYPGILDVVREIRLSTSLDIPLQEDTHATLTSVANTSPSVGFTGKSDFIGLLRQEGETVYCKIVDYKTKEYIPAGFTDPSQDPGGQKNILQINMYKWLVERALPSALRRDVKVVVEEVELVYFDMKRVIRFTSAGDIEYGKKVYKALPLYDSERMEKWIVKKVQQKLRAQTVLPPVLEEYPKYWACQRCPVQELCTTIHEKD